MSMPDIVNALREAADMIEPADAVGRLRDAADEIDKLRRLLKYAHEYLKDYRDIRGQIYLALSSSERFCVQKD